MNSRILLTFLFLSSLIIIGVFYTRSQKCDCELRIKYDKVHMLDHVNRDTLFAPIEENLKLEVVKAWKNFDSHSDSFHVAFKNTSLEIIGHYKEGNLHYGALYFPIDYIPNQQYPLLIWAPGLNQLKPEVDLDQNIPSSLFREFNDHFIAIPSFRGQYLAKSGKKFCSDGYFGDAFDGATDDCLRFQHLIKSNYPIDKNKVKIAGISRGGTIALLAAIRDSTYQKVACISGPTDFTTIGIHDRYGIQFKYQFLSEEKSINEIRKKMLRSSPIHFIDDIKNPLLLNYGDRDPIVDISNLDNLASKLGDNNQVKIIKESRGHKWGNLSVIFNWLKD